MDDINEVIKGSCMVYGCMDDVTMSVPGVDRGGRRGSVVSRSN